MASELAPGSEWAKGIVLDECGGSVRVDASGPRPVIVIEEDDYCDHTAHIADVLAVIDRANLDPVRIVARELGREIRRNLDPIRHCVPGAHYGDIIAQLKKLEALLLTSQPPS